MTYLIRKLHPYRWAIISTLIIFAAMYLYYFFSSQPHLTGQSPSKVWKAEYTRSDTYWEGTLKCLSEDDITLHRFNIIENGKKVDYSPHNDIIFQQPFDFMSLGDRPQRNETYKVQIEWKDSKGTHKETFPLERSYNPF
ncbi:hypothetical protein [Priestia aryabhattai]|uniref:hypothetical protein n=1 Tax=Priestia aryabhattai TaxID=412384 RepID=UPI002380913D|nr:hypothetical protein [Priestia aryabhattai]WDW07570.1 hypothetical protein PWC21_18870 [Priestia aryabhattai]